MQLDIITKSTTLRSIWCDSKEVVLDFAKTQEWKDNNVVKKLTAGVEYLLKKNKVEIIKGEAFLVDEHTLRVVTEDSAQTYSFNHAIVATGSRPIEIKRFQIWRTRYRFNWWFRS